MKFIRTYKKELYNIDVYLYNDMYYCKVFNYSYGIIEYYHVTEISDDNCTLSVAEKVGCEIIELIKTADKM